MERDEHDEGSVDEDEVDNTADVFQIAALLDKPKKTQEESTSLSNQIEGTPVTQKPTASAPEKKAPVKVALKKEEKEEESSSSSSDSSSFEISADNEMDVDDDDEGGGKKKGKDDTDSSNINAMIDKEMQIGNFNPAIEIAYTKDAKIEYIGDVAHVIGPKESRSVVIKHKSNTASLDLDSILCLSDKSALGVVNETFGPIISPFYRVYISRKEKKKPEHTQPPATNVETPPIVTEEKKESEKNEEEKTPVIPSEAVVGSVAAQDPTPSVPAAPAASIEDVAEPKFPPFAKVDDVVVGTKVYFLVDEKRYLHPNQLLLASQQPLDSDDDDSEVYFSDDEKEKEYNASKRREKDERKRNREETGDERPAKKSRTSGGQQSQQQNNGGNNRNQKRQRNQGGPQHMNQYPPYGGYGAPNAPYPMMAPGYTAYHYPNAAPNYPQQGGYFSPNNPYAYQGGYQQPPPRGYPQQPPPPQQQQQQAPQQQGASGQAQAPQPNFAPYNPQQGYPGYGGNY